MQDPQEHRVRRGEPRGRTDDHRRSAGGGGGPAGRTLRGSCRRAAEQHARGHRPGTGQGLHREHPEMPSPRQPQPERGGGRGLCALPAAAAGTGGAESGAGRGRGGGAQPSGHGRERRAPARPAAPAARQRCAGTGDLSSRLPAAPP